MFDHRTTVKSALKLHLGLAQAVVRFRGSAPATLVTANRKTAAGRQSRQAHGHVRLRSQNPTPPMEAMRKTIPHCSKVGMAVKWLSPEKRVRLPAPSTEATRQQ